MNQKNEVTKYVKSPIIKNLMPGLPERGKIKIGRKGDTRKGRNGDYKLPQKLDHFLITTLERGTDDNFVVNEAIHKEIGEKPKSIPITLLYDDLSLNFNCRYTLYNGKNLQCSGDGERGEWRKQDGTIQNSVCPCGKQDPKYTGKDKCKINGTLSTMIDTPASKVGGVWKFRTTGYNSTVGILSSLTLIKTLTGGSLAGIPLIMTVMPKVATDPSGRTQTIYVVGIEFDGNVATLKEVGMNLALKDATYKQRLISVEDEAKKLLSIDNNLIDEAGDISEEFFPDNEAPEMESPESVEVTGETDPNADNSEIIEAEIVDINPDNVENSDNFSEEMPVSEVAEVVEEKVAEVVKPEKKKPTPKKKPEPKPEPVADDSDEDDIF